ncbi:MAG: DUF4335 domain-containing protein [Cyanobacteriota bacterium]|nr:DUF4335 domain-containing protein [Cyanobacteriota bacterium]
MKQTLRFDQISCRLQVEGLPDVSAGHAQDAIGIITGWTLQWAGRPELEGKKEHLLALMQTVLPYARLLISGAPRLTSSDDQRVELSAAGPGAHRLLLRSSQPDTPPLEAQLDDAELADLVRVLDQLRLEPRLQLPLETPAPKPLRGRELLERIPKRQRLAAPAAALVALGLCTGASLLWPTPKPLAPQDSAQNPPSKLTTTR